MEERIKNSFEQAAAFQKVWMDSMVGAAQVWGKYSPENPPPEELKKIRKGMLDVISASWEEFMRTPQFMEMMRDSLNNAMTWQGFATEGVNRVHDVLQTASKRDVDGLLLAVRHVEKRLLDQIEAVEETVADAVAKINSRLDSDKADRLKEDQAFQKVALARFEAIERAIKSQATEGAEPRAKAAKPKTARKKATTASARKGKS